MNTLQFQYAADQPHQLAAVEAVCRLFHGQEFCAREFTAASQDYGLFQETEVGHANGWRLSQAQLLANLHAVQEDNCLPPSHFLTEGRLRDFTIEMETGTGKTYVYIRTIYELHRRYGLTKFVIVVPKVAIREGVKKSFESTRAHFETLYDKTPLEYFVYDSAHMGPVGNFATSSALQVMIINIDAFNKELDKDKKAGLTNVFHRPSEKLIGGRSPQELVSQCHPIVIIDEPQSVDNTDNAKAAIKTLNPLFVLRYSATHREKYNMLYQLGPVEAFARHLVKGIMVDSVRSQEDLNGAYVRLDGVDSSKGYKAKLTMDVRQKNGTQKRKPVSVKPGDDLYGKSQENSDYESGWVVSNIGTVPGREFIEFTNGHCLMLGEVCGDVAEEAVKRGQIRRTIENHLERQLQLYHLSIKVLSLFFIDKVEKYRCPAQEGGRGEYARIFEEEYRDLVTSERWQKAYRRQGVPLPLEPQGLHQGYFAVDGQGRLKDSKSAEDSAAAGAFQLIMRDKERLLSFPDGRDRGKDVAFIFSHSTLREGWDNPNVFQICTLVDSRNELTKRQKIGRGLRLCVDQKGRRNYDPENNVLTVIANESYRDFAAGLQQEFVEAGCRFGVLTPQSFSSLTFRTADGSEDKLGFARSQALYQDFREQGLISSTGEIQPQLRQAAEKQELRLPTGMEPLLPQVCALILHRSQKLPIRDKAKEEPLQLQQEVLENPAFQSLWERIRRTTSFEMHIDSGKLIEKAVEGLRQLPEIRPLSVISSVARLAVGAQGVQIEHRQTEGRVGEEEVHYDSEVKVEIGRHYDLPDPLAELQDAVGLTRATLARILQESGIMPWFSNDPVTFLKKVAARIEAAKLEVMAQGIQYSKRPESEWYSQDILQVDDLTANLEQNAWKPSSGKSLYNFVIYDSTTVELPFAQALDASRDVKIFTKLPARFKIDTPLGRYNPDWAFVEEKEGRQRVYFVVETKGGGNGTPSLRPAEQAKIACARKHFEALDAAVKYEVRTTYGD